jgi:alkanesulfonate monooxygenase SsuD/methylene tetrahydromethanopterin reductase-like flavin-dependent oxidoreductase (luciferase family)
MNTGLIHIPYDRPSRTARQTFDWAYENAVHADQAGLTELMVAEHATQAWECIPNPELVIAAAARDTERIKFAPMAHLLPYHTPASLAIQVGWLSRILEGRYFLGIGGGAYPNDAILRGMPPDMSENHERLRESVEIMKRVWKREPFHYEGKYFKGGFPEESDAVKYEGDEQHKLADHSPWGGEVEIAVTGLSPKSPSMKFAGENGFIPVSIFSGSSNLKSHWGIYEKSALENGHVPDRSRYHVSQTILVADTDEEARRRALGGGIGYCWEHYLWPIWERFDLISGFVADKGADAADVDMDWLCDNVWIVGSPETCARKLNELFEFCGGWGTLQVEVADYMDEPEPWFESLERLVKEVAPKVKLPEITRAEPEVVGS